MKKVYLIPELSIVKVELQHMIAESASLPLNPEAPQEAEKDGEVLSRRKSIWDDEDDY